MTLLVLWEKIFFSPWTSFTDCLGNGASIFKWENFPIFVSHNNQKFMKLQWEYNSEKRYKSVTANLTTPIGLSGVLMRDNLLSFSGYYSGRRGDTFFGREKYSTLFVENPILIACLKLKMWLIEPWSYIAPWLNGTDFEWIHTPFNPWSRAQWVVCHVIMVLGKIYFPSIPVLLIDHCSFETIGMFA